MKGLVWVACFAGACTVARGVEAAGTVQLPRWKTLSAYYMGVSFGPAALDGDTGRRFAVGSGIAFRLTLGIALWDQLPLAVGVGSFFLKDKQPLSELVVTCTSVNGTSVGCGDPEREESDIHGEFFSFESGYQRRFQPSESVSLLPELLLGYLWTPGELERGVQCDGCEQLRVASLKPRGVYVAPSFRVVFGADQFLALSLRSQWFVTGEITHMTLLGLDFLAP